MKFKRQVFQKHVQGVDDFEKIPTLSWAKFNDGVTTGNIVMDIREGTSMSGKVWRVVAWGDGGKEAYCS